MRISVRSKSVSSASRAKPPLQLGQPEPGEDRDGHRAPAERPPAATERAHRRRARLALEPPDRGHADEHERDRPADPDGGGEHVQDAEHREHAVRLRVRRSTRAPAVRGRRPARPVGRPVRRPAWRSTKEGLGGKHGFPTQNDHGPPPGTRDRPSDTGFTARLAARPASRIMRFSRADVQCKCVDSRAPRGAAESGSPHRVRSDSCSFSHSVTWMRYSFHSRRLSST